MDFLTGSCSDLVIGLIYESVIFGLTQLGAVRVYLSIKNLCSNPIVWMLLYKF